VTSTRRTQAEQQLLYERYLKGQSKYPAAPPGHSAHEYGLAFDMVVAGVDEQAAAGSVWTGWNGKYGGEEDKVHFEFPGFNPTAAATSQGTAPAAQADGWLLSTRRKAEQLADILVNLLPTPFQGILNTATVAAMILSTLGSDAASALEYLLVHPAEATDMFLDIMWGMIRAELGL
jgi:hypothetical protein